MGLAKVVEKGESIGRQNGEQKTILNSEVIIYAKQILNYLASKKQIN